MFRVPSAAAAIGILNEISTICLVYERLSFLSYCDAVSSFWTSSGSCPLCLTPPCYQLQAAGIRRLFFVPGRHVRGAAETIFGHQGGHFGSGA
jgi:hypothetical protein